MIAIDSFFTARREQLDALALRNGIAAIYQDRDFAVAGGVISLDFHTRIFDNARGA